MKYLVLMTFLIFSARSMASSCSELVLFETVKSESRNNTANFISYMVTLLEKHLINETVLSKFTKHLSQGEIKNPFQMDERGTYLDISEDKQTDAAIHYYGLQEYIEKGETDLEGLLKWSRAYLVEMMNDSIRRKRTEKRTENTHQNIEFVAIEPGKFLMGENDWKVEMEIDYKFEIMSTTVTQKQWTLVMGTNPSKFIYGEDSMTLMRNGKSITLLPNHPVEHVSWDESKQFVAKLNELSMRDDSYLYELIPDHKEGFKYRLPYEVEWEFVATNLGRSHG